MDTYYEYAGAKGASALADAFQALGLPLLVACAGIAWRIHRVAEDGAARPLATYLLSLVAIAWLIRPAEAAPGVRSPRFVALLGGAADGAVRAAVSRIDSDFLTKPFEFERVAALAGRARAADPALRERMAVFFASCTANAMAAAAPVPPAAIENPLAPDGGLPYARFSFGDTGRSCESARAEILDALRRELDREALHRAVLEAGVSRDDYLAAIVRNEWHGRLADGGETALVRRSVGAYDDHARREARHAAPVQVPGWAWVVSPLQALFADQAREYFADVKEESASAWAAAGQATSDLVTSKQRYYLVTAYAPYLYGLVLMLLTALFPVAGLWSLFPGKGTALVNYGKVFVSVKLWPVGWALLSSFSSRRPVSQALADEAGGNAFIAATLLYFAIPAFAFLVVHFATAAAAVPFREAAPAVVGASNGPVGEVGRMAIQRAR